MAEVLQRCVMRGPGLGGRVGVVAWLVGVVAQQGPQRRQGDPFDIVILALGMQGESTTMGLRSF